jgi:formate hydrogenlyase subunit 4
MTLIWPLVLQGVQMFLVLALAPLLTGYIRRLKARLQRRRGPPLLQSYRDLWRLLQKEAIVADSTSWVFRVAPYLIFAITWVAASLAPTSCSAGRAISSPSSPSSGPRDSCRRSRHWMSAPASAASDPAAR